MLKDAGSLISSEMASSWLKWGFVSRQKLHLQRILPRDYYRTNTDHQWVCQKVQKLRDPVKLRPEHQIFRHMAEGLSTCNILQNNMERPPKKHPGGMYIIYIDSAFAFVIFSMLFNGILIMLERCLINFVCMNLYVFQYRE